MGRINTEVMDQQQAQNINQAAEQFTDSTQQAFRMLADRAVSLQESNLTLTQNFLENWIEQVNNLSQGTREATQNLQEQGQRQREAVETLSEEGTNAYSEFLNSTLSLYQEALNASTQVGQQNIEQAAQAIEQAVLAASQAANQAVQQAIEAVNQAGQQAAQAISEAGHQGAAEAARRSEATQEYYRRVIRKSEERSGL